MLGIDEILNLHLLKLAAAEDEIARRNLITKRLALLSDTKRQVRVETIDDVFEIGEDTLGGFRAEVRNRLRIVGNRFHATRATLTIDAPRQLINRQLILPASTDKCLEHHVKLSRLTKITSRTTVRTFNHS